MSAQQTFIIPNLQQMLQKLLIQNYAIIDELEIIFSNKLNVITGETGAGKSIIIGALGLILGERADSTALVNKDKKCIVEGTFKLDQRRELASFFSTNDLDNGEEIVIRREIGSNGKSRAFINDTPVTLSQLNELSRLLVDLHQQFDTLALGESDFQRQVLDALASHGVLLDSYRNEFFRWQSVKKEMEELKARQQQFDKEADYNRFQFRELEEAGFRENELEETEAELKLLNNAGEIKATLNRVYDELSNGETPVLQQIRSILSQVDNYSGIDPRLNQLVERMRSVHAELKDITDELDTINNHINHDPQRMNELNERLSLGYKLEKKHGVHSTKELLEIQQQLEEQLKGELEIGELIKEKEKQTQLLFQQVNNLAELISSNRQKQVKQLESAVNKLLVQVGMPNARLKVSIERTEPGLSGANRVEFLFDANSATAKNANFQSLRKIASGGELSRLMLCIKSLVAKKLDLPTLIFDEIDSGISGEAARQVGMIMKELADNRQVICITHQPQIAGKGASHFFVYKEIVNDKVKTNIRLLSTEERITAIARMLSGEKPTAAAIENAREMVRN